MRQRDLTADAAERLGASEAIALPQANNLRWLIRGDDDEAVHPFVRAGFDQHRCVVNDHGLGILLRNLPSQACLLTGDVGMNDPA